MGDEDVASALTPADAAASLSSLMVYIRGADIKW
jgi:hypothetical protein